MNTVVNALRHREFFDPDKWGKRRIDIVGVGATGSRIALGLAKLGIREIHLWDDDKVEAHNIANQAFGLLDIGKLKVDAMKAIIKRDTGIDVTVHPVKVTGNEPLGEVVFLLTDSLASRKAIFTAGIKLKIRTKLLIETRMGAEQGNVYVINPMKMPEVRGYEATLTKEVAVKRSECGTAVTIGSTAEFISGLAVSQFVRWFGIDSGRVTDDELDHEISFYLRPMKMDTRRFV